MVIITALESTFHYLTPLVAYQKRHPPTNSPDHNSAEKKNIYNLVEWFSGYIRFTFLSWLRHPRPKFKRIPAKNTVLLKLSVLHHPLPVSGAAGRSAGLYSLCWRALESKVFHLRPTFSSWTVLEFPFINSLSWPPFCPSSPLQRNTTR